MQQEDIGLQHYFEVLWRRKWAITAVFSIVWTLAMIGVVITKTVYTVSSLVAVKNQTYWRTPIISFAQGTDEPDTTLSPEAYVDIINGQPFAGKVAEALLREGIPLDPALIHGAINAAYELPDRIRISASSPDSDSAVLLANAAASVFVEETKTTMMKRLSDGHASALAFQAKGRKELETAESEISKLRSEMGFIDLDEHITGMREKIAGFERARGEVITKLEIAQVHRKELLELARAGAEADLNLNDPRIDDYRTLQEAAAEARIRYTDDHPVVQNLNHQLKKIEDRLRLTIARSGSNLTPEDFLTLREDLTATENEIADLETAISSWTRQVDEVKAQLEGNPEQLEKLRGLEARVQTARESEKYWSRNLEELEFKKSMVPGNASLVDLAVAPHPAISKMTFAALATMFALMLAVGVGFLTEFLDTTLRSPEEITGGIDLAYLGSIVRLKDPRQVVFQEGKAINQIAEAYTRIYSNIKFAEVENPLRSILITSARKGEGKSTTLINLACAIAAAGKRVTVVDTDLRNPTLQRILGTKHPAGLTSVLAGEARLDEVLLETAHPGLTLVPAGPIPPNPAELLHSQAMRDIIKTLEGRSDVAIFDTPPTLLVADAMLLAGELDAAIIVAESGGVSRKAVAQVKESLLISKTRILGVILNKILETPGAYYNYYSYYKYYKEPEGERVQTTMGWIKDGFGSIRKTMGGRG